MKTPLDVAVLGLATARLTQLVVDDEITEPIRKRVRLKYEEAERDTRVETAWDTLDTIVNCHACSSVWAGGGVLTAEVCGGGVGRFLVRVLALSQIALAVKAVIERIDR